MHDKAGRIRTDQNKAADRGACPPTSVVRLLARIK
jgi:hypothetical protein